MAWPLTGSDDHRRIEVGIATARYWRRMPMTPRMAHLPRSDQLLMKQVRERKVKDMAVRLAAEVSGRAWLDLKSATRDRYERIARALLKIAESSRAATRANASRTPEQRSEISRKANANRGRHR
jgi:hypothetical protein